MKEQKPKISVICTCFNKGPWIRQALDSIVAQKTSHSYEIIVIDDASTDGSAAVIELFRNAHPDNTRVISHESNQGIASSWLEACKIAQGDYFARLDEDDYWTDELKLEAQVSALEDSADSRWCSTDFDMVDAEGSVIHSNVLASGVVEIVSSYEQMLATKGLTNSSTWLVDARLMREVNKGLEMGVADDTFSLQLDMFRKTRLLRIEKSMCAMRINEGSDSRPRSHEDARERFEGLKQQQIAYLEKYSDAKFGDVARYCIERDAELELYIFDLQTIERELRSYAVDLRNTVEQRDAELERMRNSRNIIRPVKNIVRSVFKHFKNSSI